MKKIRNLFYKFDNFYVSKLSLVMIVLVLDFFMIGNIEILNNDFWFIIHIGRDILTHGFSTIDTFTIHEGFHFISQQWLTGIVFYLIYDVFDVYGIFVLLVLVDLVVSYLIYKISMLVSGNKIKLSLLIVVVVNYFLLLFHFITSRPYIFDCICLLIEIYALELYVRRKRFKFLFVLPLISLLMVNLHASTWPMIFVFVLPYLGEYLWYRLFERKKVYSVFPIFMMVFFMILVSFINPYGIELIIYFFHTYGFSEMNFLIAELKPVSINGELDGKMVFVVIFFTYVVYLLHRVEKYQIRFFFFLFGTTYMALCHYRCFLFFLMAFILVMASSLSDFFKLNHYYVYMTKVVNYLFIVVIICSLVILFVFVDYENEKDANYYSIYKYLEEHDFREKEEIRIYVCYANGNYLEYMGYKVYLDARAEFFYKSFNGKEDIFKEYYALRNGFLMVDDFLERYDFDYLILEEDDIIYTNISRFDSYECVFLYDTKDTSVRLYKKVEE